MAAKTSTRWVLTLLHEHFHQFQYARPDYYPGVSALGLARGDQQGSWRRRPGRYWIAFTRS